MSVMEIKQQSCTLLTSWIIFHAGYVSNGNQAAELHTTHILDEISCQQWKSSRRAANYSLPG